MAVWCFCLCVTTVTLACSHCPVELHVGHIVTRAALPHISEVYYTRYTSTGRKHKHSKTHAHSHTCRCPAHGGMGCRDHVVLLLWLLVVKARGARLASSPLPPNPLPDVTLESCFYFHF